jgi:FkbM family methyltransferase
MEIILRKIARKLGLELSRFTPETSKAARMQRMLSYHNINLVLDIGANAGQYASSLREIGYQNKIVSFEPLSSAYNKLLSASKNDSSWVIAPRSAIGDRDGTIRINISKNSLSSSVLDMLDTHLNAAPGSSYVDSEIVDLRRLDSVAPRYMGDKDVVYLKIDVQGFEMQVLAGAAAILPKINGVQMELSLIPLYKGETLFHDMIHKMEYLGYEIFALSPGFTDANTGRLLQVDGIFFKK